MATVRNSTFIKSERRLLSIFKREKNLTLWNIQIDKCGPPFQMELNGQIVDTKGNVAEIYMEVEKILKLIQSAYIKMAIASRISDVAGAYQLLHLFGLDGFFEHKEIYPLGKKFHFMRLHTKTGIKYQDMIFYDDDKRNIRDVSQLGVQTTLVENGLNLKVVESDIPYLYLNVSS